jgi:general nucleoside transport system permease protein
MEDFTTLFLPTLAGTLRIATPLILCAMGGVFSENAGVVDIGLEGKMLAAAFASATVTAMTGSPVIGLAAGILVACLMSAVHGLACITYRGDQVVSGVAINILASGLTMVFAVAWFHMGGQTPGLQPDERFMPITLPGVDALAGVPLLGPVYATLVSGQSLLVYVALAAVVLTHWTLKRTRFGLRLRAAGEEPKAVDAAGISVAWLRYRAVLICGVFTGIAGAYLSIAQNANFSREMSAGQGYIALAALIFGKWKAWGAFWACLLFGFLDAVAIRLQGVAIGGFAVPVQLVQAMPYILTVLILAGFIGKAVAPKNDGVPYEKGS